MRKIARLRKLKATFIRWKLHRVFGRFANAFILLGYMTRLSKWVEQNKGKLSYNDFHNPKPDHKERVKLYDYYLKQHQLDTTAITYLEFGVGRGNSLRWWSEHNQHKNSQLWAFDTFTGLPEEYGLYKKGVFDVKGNFPQIDDNRITFVKGLIQDTFLDTIQKVDFSQKVMIHIDVDLHSASLYALAMLSPYLKKGDTVIFDEFGVPTHEFRAFEDFTKSFPVKLEPVGAINNYLQVIFEVQ